MEVLVANYGYTERVSNYLEDRHFNLGDYMSHGDKEMIANETGIPLQSVKGAISYLRQKTGKVAAPLPVVRGKKVYTGVYDYCVDKGFFRKNPQGEDGAMRTIQEAIKNWLPDGGGCIVTGTPSPYSISQQGDSGIIWVNNLDIFSCLNIFTDEECPHVIVIGNAMNPEKAHEKALNFKKLSTTRDYKIIETVVDREGFRSNVGLLCERNKDITIKCILMSGGSWEGSKTTSRKNGGLDLNFKEPSHYLSRRYPNLHILAMTNGPTGKTFDVHYIHKGEDIIVPPVYKKKRTVSI